MYSSLKPVPEGTGADETLVWNVPISNCGITASTVAASGTVGEADYTPEEIHHVIYINPPAASAHVMHQVKLTCKHVTLLDERVGFKIIFFWVLNHRASFKL